MTNSGNFNNPSKLNVSDSYSVISPYLEYGEFKSADPSLEKTLPKILNAGKNNNGNANNYHDINNVSKGNKNINVGLTSPGTVEKSMSCSGLDYIQTNPDYSTLTFQTCLDKFEKQYFMPNIVFNNLLNNLPYTFDRLSKDDKKDYLKSLQKFINNQEKEISNNENGKTLKQDLNTKENFIDKKYLKSSCSDDGFSLTGILTIVIVLILIIIFLIFITKNN